MPAKKHYWTQVFLVTTLMSCGLGLVTGFFLNGWCVSSRTPRHQPVISLPCAKQKAFLLTEEGRLVRSNSECKALSPFIQPGAIMLCPVTDEEGVPIEEQPTAV